MKNPIYISLQDQVVVSAWVNLWPIYEKFALVGDINGDCIVDDTDLALLQENWLQDNSVTEDWVILP